MNLDRDNRTVIARHARRELARRSFSWFARHLWDRVAMTRPLLPSVAFDGVCAALQAVADGRIRRLVIAQPPGTGKSVLGSVLWPAYLFLKSNGAQRIMCGSYSHGFAMRDATRCRDLMRSDEYRALVLETFRIRRFPDRVDDFWLTAGGRRVIVSPKGASMGERCTTQIIDDALSGKDAYSDAAKRDARRWISALLPSRMEDHEHDPRVLIAQRLATDDPPQWAIDAGWRVLDLTAILGRDANLDAFDQQPCELRDDHDTLVWRDPRGPGETVSPLLTEASLRTLRADMGAAQFAAQFLQRPFDDATAVFRRAWFGRRYSDMPEVFERTVIAVDASFKEGDDSDYAVIQAWGSDGDDRYLIEQWRRRAGFVDTLEALRGFRARWPSARVLIEAGANGYAIVDQLDRELGAGVVESVSAAGGKMPRAQATAPIAERGKVVLPGDAPWLVDWIEEICQFPNADHDDQLDAMCYALLALDDRSHEWPQYGSIVRASGRDPRRW